MSCSNYVVLKLNHDSLQENEKHSSYSRHKNLLKSSVNKCF